MRVNRYEHYEIAAIEDNNVLQIGLLGDNIEESITAATWLLDEGDLVVRGAGIEHRYLSLPKQVLEVLQQSEVLSLLDVSAQKVYQIKR